MVAKLISMKITMFKKARISKTRYLGYQLM